MSSKRVTALAAVGAVGAAALGGQLATAADSSPSAGRATTFAMSEFKFKPKQLSTKAGKWRVTAKNTGKLPHEFILIRTKRAAKSLPVKGSKAVVKGAVGDIPEQKPGKRASHTFKVKRGRYVFICNVAGHYKAGMYGTLKVK
jgi:uncharacterized cupredoxin-like copper-binding protein